MVKVKEIVPTETFRAIARKVNIRFIEKLIYLIVNGQIFINLFSSAKMTWNL